MFTANEHIANGNQDYKKTLKMCWLLETRERMHYTELSNLLTHARERDKILNTHMLELKTFYKYIVA